MAEIKTKNIKEETASNKLQYVVFFVIAIISSMLTIKGCSSKLIPTLICGSDSNDKIFKKLRPEEVSIKSNIYESIEYSIKKGLDASKLMDGSDETMAYPASRQLDYTIILLNKYRLQNINILWNDYGVNRIYINNWSLEAFDGNDWQTLAKGKSPKEQKTTIETSALATKLRIKATSDTEWIGVYELEITAKPL